MFTFAKAGWQTKSVDIKAVTEETYQQMNMLINLTRNKQNRKLPNSILVDYFLLGYLVRFTFLTLVRKGISNELMLRHISYDIAAKCLEIKPDMLMKLISGLNVTEEVDYLNGVTEANSSMFIFESGSDKSLIPIMKHLDDNYGIVF